MFNSTISRKVTLAATAAALALTAQVSAPAASAAVEDSYVALGDSYSSGNGTFNADLDWGCYRSSSAYPSIVDRERANTALTFAACQGAETGDIVSTQKYYLDADTDYVTITIGGNDIGFADVIIYCAGSYSPNCESQINESRYKIYHELPAKLDAAYAAIKSRTTAVKKVVVLGYGKFFSAGHAPCSAASGVTAEEAVWANALTDDLEGVTRDRATAAGFTYQSSIAKFTGHDVCAADPYLNGDSWSASDGWHPTKSGHNNGLAPLVRTMIG